ncbi:UNVERIFIED_ORG: ornithine cyclodeaminase/alanine dehydrogenase-like protein (mu-crystallin family) [Rhizobium esperanzae]
MAAGTTSRQSDDQITVFKNGGGAHLDLMMASYVVGAVNA